MTPAQACLQEFLSDKAPAAAVAGLARCAAAKIESSGQREPVILSRITSSGKLTIRLPVGVVDTARSFIG